MSVRHNSDPSTSKSPPAAGLEPFRELTRAPLQLPVKLKFDSFGQMLTGFTANVSRGGMFVGGAEARPVGTLIKFELNLAPSLPPIVGLGEVVWIRLKQRELGLPPGMGVQFRYLDAENQSRLDAALQAAALNSSRLEERAPSEPRTPEATATPTRTSRMLSELEEALARCENLRLEPKPGP